MCSVLQISANAAILFLYSTVKRVTDFTRETIIAGTRSNRHFWGRKIPAASACRGWGGENSRDRGINRYSDAVQKFVFSEPAASFELIYLPVVKKSSDI